MYSNDYHYSWIDECQSMFSHEDWIVHLFTDNSPQAMRLILFVEGMKKFLAPYWCTERFHGYYEMTLANGQTMPQLWALENDSRNPKETYDDRAELSNYLKSAVWHDSWLVKSEGANAMIKAIKADKEKLAKPFANNFWTAQIPQDTAETSSGNSINRHSYSSFTTEHLIQSPPSSPLPARASVSQPCSPVFSKKHSISPPFLPPVRSCISQPSSPLLRPLASPPSLPPIIYPPSPPCSHPIKKPAFASLDREQKLLLWAKEKLAIAHIEL